MGVGNLGEKGKSWEIGKKGDTGRKRRKKDKGNERVGFGEKLN